MSDSLLVLIEDSEFPETIRCLPLPGNRAMVAEVPALSNRIGFGDVITFTSNADGVLTFSSIVENAGWSTFGLVISPQERAEAAKSVASLERQGCVVTIRDEVYVSVAADATSFAATQETIEDGERLGLWRAGIMRQAPERHHASQTKVDAHG